LELLHQAVRDPTVLAIKQTLYRTGADSPVVEALVEAARSGKAVTACVELRARFDEAANLDLADRLAEAGANVVYGVVGVKTHAKMLLIVRREGDRLHRYVHLGTGNYHATTARLYTDFSLLTCDETIAGEVQAIFQQLTGPGAAPTLTVLAQSPFRLKSLLLDRISAEASAARAGRPSGIRAKLNALTDSGIIRALYEASGAGVPIELTVRGACRLRPGLPGISDTIHVRSVIGRFLEHARVYHFHANGDDEVWCASADWMERNLHRRVEVAFPITDPVLRSRVLRESLDLGELDDEGAWTLQADGTYLPPSCETGFSSQRQLLEELASRPGS
jgi:polyphosphate kinase